MADKFEFRGGLVKPLDIAGQSFDVTTGDVVALQAGLALSEKLKSIDLKDVGADTYMCLCDEIMQAVDDILGEGACKRVLAGRRVNIIDLVDLLVFVLREVTTDFNAALGDVVADLTAIASEE